MHCPRLYVLARYTLDTRGGGGRAAPGALSGNLYSILLGRQSSFRYRVTIMLHTNSKLMSRAGIILGHCRETNRVAVDWSSVTLAETIGVEGMCCVKA
ncbi:hypothetical protein Ddc_22053 [Ditylenchus destructor]|nr:hypothetical protein Ddc_22053 [Ditylenchus destructor]